MDISSITETVREFYSYAAPKVQEEILWAMIHYKYLFTRIWAELVAIPFRKAEGPPESSLCVETEKGIFTLMFSLSIATFFKMLFIQFLYKREARHQGRREILCELSTVPLDERSKIYARLCKEVGVQVQVKQLVQAAWDNYDIHQPD